MKFAVVIDNFVTNVIVANPEQKEELESALGAELTDAQPFDLQIGDLRVDGNWTRNSGGEQVVLSELPTYEELLECVRALGVMENVI